MRLRALACFVALATAALVAPGCAATSGAQCVMYGFVRDGMPPEAAHADLRAAMVEAERALPAPAVVPGDAASVDAAQAVLRRRIEHVHAALAARGYRRVEKLVDCDELPMGTPAERR